MIVMYGGMARNDRVFVLTEDGHLYDTITYEEWWAAGGPQWWYLGEADEEET